MLQQARQKLKRVYSESHDADTLRQRKQQVFIELQEEYTKLKHQQWNNDKRYDNWMAQPLNNAHLALVATYHDLVPAFQRQLENVQADLPEFYKQMKALSELPKAERHDQLMNTTSKRRISQAK